MKKIFLLILFICVMIPSLKVLAQSYSGNGCWEPWSFVKSNEESIVAFDMFSRQILGYTSNEYYETGLPYPLNTCLKSSAFISYDEGKTFKKIFESLGDTANSTLNQPYRCAKVLVIDSLTILLRLYNNASDSFPHLYAKTTNGGQSWSIRPWICQDGSMINTVYGLAMNNAEFGIGWNRLYISFIDDSTNTIFTCKDFGMQLYNEGKFINNVQRLSKDSCIALAITSDTWKSTLLVSGDRGQSWIRRELPDSISSMYFVNDSVGWFSATSDIITSKIFTERIYKTTDAGRTLSLQMEKNMNKNILTSIYFLNEEEGIVIGSQYIYHTYDGGNTWLSDSITGNKQFGSPNFICAPRNCSKMEDIYFKVYLVNDFWRFRLFPLSSNEYEMDSQLKAFPNPFNRTTTITFNARFTGNYNLFLYDQAGHRVFSDKKFVNAGSNGFELTTDGLAQGVYFYEITNYSERMYGKVIQIE